MSADRDDRPPDAGDDPPEAPNRAAETPADADHTEPPDAETADTGDAPAAPAGEGQTAAPRQQPPEHTPEFDALLAFIRDTRGFDFSVYKRNTLWRRFKRRLAELDLDSFSEYQDVLQGRPSEYNELFNTFLINVTSFFRDAEAWQAVNEIVIPAITDGITPDDPLRAWCPGCSTGEEAYTMAILLAEAVPGEIFPDAVKIYATDLDYPALEKARRGVYSAKEVEPIPDDLRKKYLKKTKDGYAFANGVRRSVIFGKHNLLRDAPISRLDLLVCRNTLMYFNANTQADILARFHFALNREGYLFLGKAEMLLTHTNLFTPANLNLRLFRKVPGAMADARVRLRATRPPERPTSQRATEPHTAFDAAAFDAAALDAAALDAAPEAMVILAESRKLAAANRRARSLFRLGKPDLGKPFQDLELSYRPVELRSVIDAVAHQRQATTVDDVHWEPSEGKARTFRVYVAPLFQGDGTVRGMLIAFRDETECTRLETELEQSRTDLQAAYEELQSTNEELETTNEELQSSNEELETTNEELQASNEELETTNEELQATNEELKTMNDQLRSRTDELDNVNAFLESVLDGLQAGVVAVDEEMQVESWNAQAAELWGLGEDEVVGQHLMNLDIGLELDGLHKAVRRVLSGEVACEQKTMDAVNRRGQSVRCRTRIQTRTDAQDNLRGAILLMEEVGDDTARDGDADGSKA